MLWTYTKTRSRSIWITFGLGLVFSTILIVIALLESLARNKQWSLIEGPDVYPGPVIDTLITLTQRTAIPVYGLALIMAVTAASRTANRVRSGDYILLILTTVPDWKLVRAHFLHVLLPWRMPLVFLIAMAPLYIVIGLLPDVYWCGVVKDGVCWSGGSPMENGWIALAKLIGLWLTINLGVYIGLWFGLWWRNTLSAVSGTITLLLTILGIMLGIQNRDVLGFQLYRVTYILSVQVLRMQDNPFFNSVKWSILTYVFVPLILTGPVLYLAFRNVRKADKK